MNYRVTTAFCLALAVSAPAVMAADDTPCDCWYAGYEDGLEFPWHERENAEGYKQCAGSGKTKQYEDGFTQSMKQEPRECPFSR